MPNPPAVGEQNKFGESWDGQRWNAGSPSSPMIQMPPRTPSGRTNGDDLELLKQFLTTGGTIAGGLLGGPPGAIAGGAAGRMLGHAPEALFSSTTGRPSDSSFMGDAALGAMEGGAQEMLPAVAGPAMRFGGKALKVIGKTFGDVPDTVYKNRALAGLVRGIGARELGLPHIAQGAATVGPIVASEVGGGLERAGNAVGSGTLSQRVRGGIESLMERLRPAATHGEQMAAASEHYAGAKTADELQSAARARASGVTHLGEDIPTTAVVRPTTPAEPVFGEWAPRGSDEPGPFGFSPDHMEMARGLRKSGFYSDTAAKIAGSDLADPSIDALKRYLRKSK